MADEPHKSADVLRYLLHDEELSEREVAAKFEVTRGAIRYWMDKHEIEANPNPKVAGNRVFDPDADDLREWYHDDGMSAQAIADEHGVSDVLVLRRMNEHGIERRGPAAAKRRAHPYARLVTTDEGYERWKDETGSVTVHQLVAIANGADPHEVFDADVHCHHRNGIPWDNRASNIEVLSLGEHARHHRTLDIDDRDRDERGRFAGNADNRDDQSRLTDDWTP